MWLKPREIIGVFHKFKLAVSNNYLQNNVRYHSNAASYNSSSFTNGLLKSIPEASDTGASTEPIRFNVLGDSFNILNVKVPRSAVFNIRSDTNRQYLISSTGEINKMEVDKFIINQNEGSRKTIEYQSCINNSGPMSVLLGLNSQHANFSVLTASDQKRWMIRQDELSVWQDDAVEIHSVRSLSKFVQVSGKGKFAISSPGNIIEIQLAKDESIFLNPHAIVGYTNVVGNAKPDNEIENAANELISGLHSIASVKLSQTRKLDTYLKNTQNAFRTSTEFGKKAIQKVISFWKENVTSKIKHERSINLISEKKTEGQKNDVRMKTESVDRQNTKKRSSVIETKKRSNADWMRTLRTIWWKSRNFLHAFGSVAWRTLSNLFRVVQNSIIVFFTGYHGNYLVRMKGPKTILVHDAINLRSGIMTKSELKRLKSKKESTQRMKPKYE